MNMAVVVAGGQTQGGIVTDTVDILVVEEGDYSIQASWMQGESMVSPVWNAASTTAHDQQKLLVIGGITASGEISNLMHEMQCLHRTCHWSSEYELSRPMANPIAMALPPSPLLATKEVISQECPDLKHGAPPAKLALIWLAGWTGAEAAMDSDIVLVSIKVNSQKNTTTLQNPLSHRCRHDKLHLQARRMSGTGGLLILESKAGEYSTVFCGGLEDKDDSIPSRNCYVNGQLSGRSLSTPRYGAASIVIGSGTILWVTGGQDGNVLLNSTEVIDFSRVEGVPDEKDGVKGVDLPGPLSHHCLLRLDVSTVLLVGGSFHGNPTHHSWAYAASDPACPQQFYWTAIGSMRVARERHTCGMITVSTSEGNNIATSFVVVVAAGGRTAIEGQGQAITSSVELLVLIVGNNGEGGDIYKSTREATWTDGPDLKEPLEGGALVSHGKLYLAGGATVDASSRAVYVFECDITMNSAESLACQWTGLGTELSFGRSYLLGVLLPDIPPVDAAKGRFLNTNENNHFPQFPNFNISELTLNLRVTDPTAYRCGCYEELKDLAAVTGSVNKTELETEFWFTLKADGNLMSSADNTKRGYFLM